MKQTLPIFPNFEKLSLDHKDLLQAIASNFPSSDFNFAGLFTWDIDGSVAVSSLNDNLVICSSDYLTRGRFYSFIGGNKVDETVKTLIDYAQQRGETPVLKLIPESVAKKIKRTDLYFVNEDRDNHDYIYRISDWAEFSGGKYQGKRRLLNKFTRQHEASLAENELDLNNDAVRQDIKSVVRRWVESRGKHGDEVRDELTAIEKALDHHHLLGIRAFGIYRNGILIAFTIFEVLSDNVAIGHFEKADTQYEGVFIYLKQLHAKHLSKAGVELINTEQDLGIDGQRQSKESLRPAGYIKKYTVGRIE